MSPANPVSGSRARPGGGFNQGLGSFNDEQLNENSMQQAMQQKQASQQATAQQQAVGAGQGGQKALQDLGAAEAGSAGGFPADLANQATQAKGTGQPAQPRQLGTIKQELVERPLKDISAGLRSIFDINTILGINPHEADTPEEQAKKKQLQQRWNKLNQEQQELARRKYQEAMQKKQQEEQEAQMRKQQEEQAKQQASVAPPASPQKGPVGPGGSGKKRTMAKLEQDRKGIGNPQGSN